MLEYKMDKGQDAQGKSNDVILEVYKGGEKPYVDFRSKFVICS
jgi:hypothetical protein